jgi:hypothetical protein
MKQSKTLMERSETSMKRLGTFIQTVVTLNGQQRIVV